MNSPKFSNDRCERILDVLKHKFIYNTIVDLYNEEYFKEISYKTNIYEIDEFIIMIFKDNILLRKLFDKLRKKYSKLPH
jgi:hypothetical protein